jgi:hypothetical protein
MKILIVNRFFGGAQIPTGRMAEDVARVLVECGHEVTALASTGTYSGAEKQPQHGTWSIEHGVGGMRLEQVHVPKWMPRALAWLWFTWQARKRIPRMDWDVCVLMTDPPLQPLLAPRAARPKDEEPKRSVDSGRRSRGQTKRRRDEKTDRRVAVWMMDLYPEALAASGRLSETNPIYRWYFNKRQRALGKCDLLIFLGETQKALVEKREGEKVERCEVVGGQEADGTRQTKTMVVPPWDDRGNIALATEESLRNLALYAGNLGEAHCFEEILAAVPFLPADWRIRFAVRGAKSAGLKAAANELKSPRNQEAKRLGAEVEVTGYASEEETPRLLASARVHLITMSPGWEGIVVPSKLYGCIRTGRPVLFVGPENADTAREIRANDWGGVLPPRASGELVAAAILKLAARPTREVRMQRGAVEVARELANLAGGDR